MMLVAGILAFAGVANASVLAKSGNWTMANDVGGSTSVLGWDSTVYTESTLNSINLSVFLSTLVVTSSSSLNIGENEPSLFVTLTINGDTSSISMTTATSGSIGSDPEVNENSTYTYTFGVENTVTTLGSLTTQNDKDFFDTAGSISYTVTFGLKDHGGEAISPENYLLSSGSGQVVASYSYTGVVVPEPATGALALAGIGMLFARRRRREA